MDRGKNVHGQPRSLAKHTRCYKHAGAHGAPGHSMWNGAPCEKTRCAEKVEGVAETRAQKP